jgi:hypothetical protein
MAVVRTAEMRYAKATLSIVDATGSNTRGPRTTRGKNGYPFSHPPRTCNARDTTRACSGLEDAELNRDPTDVFLSSQT